MKKKIRFFETIVFTAIIVAACLNSGQTSLAPVLVPPVSGITEELPAQDSGEQQPVIAQVQTPVQTQAPVQTQTDMNWTAVTDSKFGASQINKIIWADSKFFAVGYQGKISTSPDGITWTAVTNSAFGADNRIMDIAWGNGRFVVVGNRRRIATSADGVNWTVASNTVFGVNDAILGVAWGNNRFVAAGELGKMMTSPDGVNWTAVADSKFVEGITTGTIYGITWANGKFVAVGQMGNHGLSVGRIATSPDGVNWTVVADTRFGSDFIRGIAWCNNRFVAWGQSGKMATSPDGENWTAVADSAFSNDQTTLITGVAWGNGRYIAVGYEIDYSTPGWDSVGKTAVSTDGLTWRSIANPLGNSVLWNVAWGNGKFVVSGGNMGAMAWTN